MALSDVLLLVLLPPLIGALFFAWFPAKPQSLPSLAALFSYFYAALAGTVSVLALYSGSGFALAGPGLRLGVSGFEMQPRFFLDGRNALFILLLGLCLPVLFTLLRDRESRYGKSHYACARWSST
jgi:hypothetical protein